MGLLGAGRTDPELDTLRKEQGAWARLLGAGETVQSAHHLGRSTVLFTNRRLILVEEGMTGRQIDYLSVPYRSVTCFSVESSGAFNADAELRIWVNGRAAPIEKSFGRQIGPGADVYAVQALLAQHVTDA